MINKENLYPKVKEYSIVIIDLWEPNVEEAAFKLLEVNSNELEKTITEISKILNIGNYLMVYDRNGMTIPI